MKSHLVLKIVKARHLTNCLLCTNSLLHAIGFVLGLLDYVLFKKNCTLISRGCSIALCDRQFLRYLGFVMVLWMQLGIIFVLYSWLLYHLPWFGSLVTLILRISIFWIRFHFCCWSVCRGVLLIAFGHDLVNFHYILFRFTLLLRNSWICYRFLMINVTWAPIHF